MLCTLASRGLWLHMIRVMHEAEPFGFFVSRGGETVDPVGFARRIAVPLRDVRKSITELEKHGVFSRDNSGRIYCRRMVRDNAVSLDASISGKEGGNPKLRGDNQPDKGQPLKAPLKGWDKLARTIPDFQSTQSNSDSLRSSAVAFGSWPERVDRLRVLALIFIAEFANCRDGLKAEKYVGHYAGVLATVRSRGLSIAQAWQACADAREACGGRPLFGGSVKTAISFLPAKTHSMRGPTPEYKSLAGEDAG
jgi:hypothetical protein